MNLRGRKIRSRSFRHFLFNQPSGFTKEEVKTLVAELLAGSYDARDRLILHYMNLSLTIVGRYLTVLGKSERWSDELASAAVIGMTQKIEKIRQGRVTVRDFEITGKVVNAIHNSISREYDRSKVVRVPQRTQRARLKAGKDLIPEPKVYESKLLELKGHEYVNHYDSAPDEQVHMQGWWKFGSQMRRSARHVMVDDNLHNVICNDEFEKSVFEQCNYSPNQTNESIAEALGVSRETVRKARKRIGERLRKVIEL